MTFEQETKEISDFLRMKSGCFSASGILANAADRLDTLSAMTEQYEEEMRDLASWLGACGYNATEVTPKMLAEKIRWGIDHIVRVESKRRDDLIEQQTKQIEALRKFAQDIMEFWPHSELDGCDLQTIAENHGLLEPETRTGRCKNCSCDIDAPVWVCYRKTKLLTGQ